MWFKSPRVLFALLAAAALLTVAFWPSSRLVDVAEVDVGAVRQTIDAEGRTRVIDRFLLSSPVSGVARRLELQPGDRVDAGQRVVVIDPAIAAPLDARSRAAAEAGIAAARSRLSLAEEQLLAAGVSYEQAESDARRQRELATKELAAAERVEQAETTRRLAERALASASFARATAAHELDVAQAALRFGEGQGDPGQGLVLTAPVSGVLLRRHFESSRPVQAGEALIEIGDPARLEVEVDVLSSDAVRLREGMPVDLLSWGESEPLQGSVRRVEPGGFTKFSALGVEEQRVWVIVDLLSERERWERLGDAYRVNARFLLSEVLDTVRVPLSATFRDDGGIAVFRLQDGRAQLTHIRLGLQGGGHAAVVDGLAAGDQVIVHPDRVLEDGARVRARQ